ncbi:MAG: hypothetical protein L0H94_09105 [Nitrospira sp.]|nr:hypothetical protein [Nitrospira sp.]
MVSTIPISRSNKLIALLALALFADLPACGSAPTEETSNPGTAVVGGASETRVPATEEDSHRQIATAPRSNGPSRPALTSDQPSQRTPEPPQPEMLVMPDWIAQALESADIGVRLQALDRWGQQGQTASLDPLVVALDDEDEDARAKAMGIIERQWGVEPEGSEQGAAGSSEPRASSE